MLRKSLLGGTGGKHVINEVFAFLCKPAGVSRGPVPGGNRRHADPISGSDGMHRP